MSGGEKSSSEAMCRLGGVLFLRFFLHPAIMAHRFACTEIVRVKSSAETVDLWCEVLDSLSDPSMRNVGKHNYFDERASESKFAEQWCSLKAHESQRSNLHLN